MIKRKFITFILVTIMSIFCLSGCKKVVHTDTTIVEATVVETYHKAAWIQPVYTGKSFTYITHPARYEVTLQYEGYRTIVNDEYLYNQYKDNIGAIVECNLITIYYDDGASETKLKWEDNNE